MKIHSASGRQFENCPNEIPDELLNEEWANRNHGQTLEKLNRRGGMGILEILDNIHHRRLTWRDETDADLNELKLIITNYKKQKMDQYTLSFWEAGEAAVRTGKRIQREGWNGKGIWICYGEARTIPASSFWNEHTRNFAEQNGGEANVGAYFILKSAQGNIEMGWKPTAPDMFTKDWRVID